VSNLPVFIAPLFCLLVLQSPPAVSTYRLEPTDTPTIKKRYTAEQLGVLEKLNRRDLEHLIRLDAIVVPETWTDELSFSPLPADWPAAQAHLKALVVDQPSQLFGAYEAGKLVRWGPVSSGRKETPTPAGEFTLTWRAKSRRSTDNEQWVLKWYFNFVNARGVSFHQFDLPGVAASHACVRLLERDARWVYDWGQEWTLSPDRKTVLATGTPVVIVGTYAFDRPAPWLSLEWWKQRIVLPSVLTGG